MVPTALRPLLLVVNPVAGRRLGSKYLSDIITVLTAQGFLATVFITDARGDATHFVAARGRDFTRIVCAGGDGTLNETVSGMLGAGLEIPLGYIPAGSTNVFAYSHHLSTHPLHAAADAASNRVLSLDAGRFGDRYFAYVAAFGMFTCLSFTTPQVLKNRLGHTAYILDSIRDLAQVRPEHIRIVADGAVHEGNYLFGAVCNATTLARAVKFPKGTVDMSDGRFEVILIAVPQTPLELQETLPALRTRDYEGCRAIDFFHAAALRVECAADLEWTLDGEPVTGLSEAEVIVLPGAMHLACP